MNISEHLNALQVQFAELVVTHRERINTLEANIAELKPLAEYGRAYRAGLEDRLIKAYKSLGDIPDGLEHVYVQTFKKYPIELLEKEVSCHEARVARKFIVPSLRPKLQFKKKSARKAIKRSLTPKRRS